MKSLGMSLLVLFISPPTHWLSGHVVPSTLGIRSQVYGKLLEDLLHGNTVRHIDNVLIVDESATVLALWGRHGQVDGWQ